MNDNNNMSGPEEVTVADVEQLVLRFYATKGSNVDVSHIDKLLKGIQHGNQAWSLADFLMSSEHQSVRFFAALTFTVKLNQLRGVLTRQDTLEIRRTLLSWLARLFARGESQLVMRKLCSTLATYFVLPGSAWQQCVRHIVCCLYRSDYVEEEALSAEPPIGEMFLRSSASATSVTFWFATSLAEEVGKLDPQNAQSRLPFTNMEENMHEVEALMRIRVLNAFNCVTPRLRLDCLDCYEAWVGFADHAGWSTSSTSMECLRSSLPFVLSWIEHKEQHNTDEETFDRVIKLVTDLASDHPTFFSHDHQLALLRLLGGPWGREQILVMHRDGYDEENIGFTRLMSAVGQLIMDDLVQSPERGGCAEFLGTSFSVQSNKAPRFKPMWDKRTTSYETDYYHREHASTLGRYWICLRGRPCMCRRFRVLERARGLCTRVNDPK